MAGGKEKEEKTRERTSRFHFCGKTARKKKMKLEKQWLFPETVIVLYFKVIS